MKSKYSVPSLIKDNSSAVIITGASDGIGRGMALAFAARGFKLGLLARRGELLNSVAQQCRTAGAAQVEFLAVDVCHTTLFRTALKQLEEKLGTVEYFIANAGINSDISSGTDGYEEAERVLNVNVMAAVAGLEYFKARWVHRGHGVLVGVTSVASARGLPASGVYCASKAALSVYLESLRLDMKRYGIKVVDIVPGFIDTDMTRRNTNPKPFMIEAERAGEIFVKALLQGKTKIIGPWPFHGIYWILRHLPDFLYQGLGRSLGKLKPLDDKG